MSVYASNVQSRRKEWKKSATSDRRQGRGRSRRPFPNDDLMQLPVPITLRPPDVDGLGGPLFVDGDAETL